MFLNGTFHCNLCCKSCLQASVKFRNGNAIKQFSALGGEGGVSEWVGGVTFCSISHPFLWLMGSQRLTTVLSRASLWKLRTLVNLNRVVLWEFLNSSILRPHNKHGEFRETDLGKTCVHVWVQIVNPDYFVVYFNGDLSLKGPLLFKI